MEKTGRYFIMEPGGGQGKGRKKPHEKQRRSGIEVPGPV
jgi:hypothetical protein